MNHLQDDLAEVREKLVTDVYRVVLPVAVLPAVGSLLRNHEAGLPLNSPLPVAVLVLPALTHVLRGRLTASFRARLLILVFLASGISGLYTLGIAAPGAAYFPAAVILSWLLLGAREGGMVATVAFLSMVVAGWKNVHLGGNASAMGEWNSKPTFWFQMIAVQIAVGSLVLVTVRRLLTTVRDREAELRADRDRLRGVLEGIQDALLVHEIPSGRFLEVNRRAEELFGFPRERLMELSVADISAIEPGFEMEKAKGLWEKALAEGPQVFAWKCRKSDGTVFWSEVAMRSFPVAGQQRLLVTVRDIDDRIHDKMELERLNADLEERVARRTESLERSRRELIAFSYAVSHDLRAPLRAVSVYAQVLQEDHAKGFSKEAREVVERILAGSARMGRIIEALLDLSMLERKRVRLVSVDMDALVGEIREELTVSSVSDLAPDPEWIVEPLPPCFSDPDLIRQVWANLLLNATKFSHLAAAPVIRVSAERWDGWTWYVVRDNGPGFEPEMAEDLFGMFRRGHGQAVEGMGIGLATTKRILLRLDGDILAEGRPGEGAVFKFRVGDPTKDGGS